MAGTVLGKTPGMMFAPGIYRAWAGTTLIPGGELAVHAVAQDPFIPFVEVPVSGILRYVYNGMMHVHTYTSRTSEPFGLDSYYVFRGLDPSTESVFGSGSPGQSIFNNTIDPVSMPVSVTTEEISPTNHRGGKTGLFIAKPGANALSCSDGDLLFDSTMASFLQILTKGTATIEKAESKTEARETRIDTAITTQHVGDAPVFVSWKVMVPSTNLHPVAYPSSWNSSINESYVTVSIPFINLDFSELGPPQETGFVPGTSLTARTTANTDNHPASANTIDIFFKNGSPNHDHKVQWMLYKEKASG